jgi:MFS family permease
MAPLAPIHHQPLAVCRLVPLLMLLALVGHFNRVAISVAGTEVFQPRYHLSEQQLGAVYTSYLVVYSLLMLPGGWLVDRWGARRALLAMALLSAALVALTGLAGAACPDGSSLLLVLLVVRSALGAASVPLHPGCARLATEHTPPGSRRLANGAITAAALVGVAASYVGFGWLMDQLGWAAAFVACGLVSLALAACFALVTRHLAPAPSRPPAAAALPAAPRLVKRSLTLLVASYAVVGYFQYLFFYWLQYYFTKVVGLDDVTSRSYTTAANLAMALGMVLGGFLTDRLPAGSAHRLGRGGVPLAGMLGCAALAGLGVVPREPLAVWACFAGALALLGLSEASFWAAAIELGGRRGGSAAALMNTGGNVGGLLAPWATPWLAATALGWQGGILVASGLCAVGGLAWLGIRTPGSAGETAAGETADA